MHIHILGICGTLMGSIALLARELGHQVTGSDLDVYPPMSTQLEEAGIDLSVGYRDDSVPPETELVIVGNANLPRGNPALESVLNRNLAYTSGAEWLSRYLLQDRWVIAVAGTHGKTTITSMISWILEHAGLQPGFLIGGRPMNFEHSSRLGAEPFFVIEADEYDTSYFDRRSKFLHYRPRTLVLNNLEFDHADIFDDIEAIKTQFHLLLRALPGNGLVIHPETDANLNDVLARGCWTPQLAIGGTGLHANLINADATAFDVIEKGKPGARVEWQLTGDHNVHNALSAVAAARHAGVAIEVACEALSSFQGVKRRMELLFQAPGMNIYDDFAHHPTEIKTTLQGLRRRVGKERVIAMIEPASHTMKTGVHAETLLASAGDADAVYWYQPDTVKWDMSGLAASDSHLVSSVEQLLKVAKSELAEPNVERHIVIMSNGSFMGLHQKLVKLARASSRKQ